MSDLVKGKPEGKAALHSRYNPVAEAQKYLDSLSLRQGIRFFILIEPGMGYITPLLEKKFPDAKIISLHIEDENIQNILEKAIPDTEAANIEIIEWKPSLSYYGRQYLRLLSETAAFIKRADANKRTTAYFGKKWFRNFFKNIAALKETFAFEKKSPASCVVAGAGPGLETALPLIAKLQQKRNVFVLSVSAAASAFFRAGVKPDMVIASDGGNWALFHLFSSLRLPLVNIALSTIASAPSQISSQPTLLISDGSVWQSIVLNSLNIPFISLPQRGTVTASALDLAFSLFSGAVFIAGMDLANNDITAHARPYALDLTREKETRLKPAYSETFARSMSENDALRIYAEWFKRQLPLYPKRLYTIGKNHPVFSALPIYEEYKEWETQKIEPKFFKLNGGDKRIENGEKTLIRALYADKTVKKELSDILFPDNLEISEDNIAKEIHCVRFF